MNVMIGILINPLPWHPVVDFLTCIPFFLAQGCSAGAGIRCLLLHLSMVHVARMKVDGHFTFLLINIHLWQIYHYQATALSIKVQSHLFWKEHHEKETYWNKQRHLGTHRDLSNIPDNMQIYQSPFASTLVVFLIRPFQTTSVQVLMRVTFCPALKRPAKQCKKDFQTIFR